jgi:hypothetical protein
MIHIIRTRATPEQLSEMLASLETYIKLAVDIREGILASGGVMHADCEASLLEAGSQQEDIWGAHWNPAAQQVTFESSINIRARQNNPAIEILDPAIREQVAEIVQKFVRWNMKDWTDIRVRYLQDEIPVRLGGLAANLLRIKSFSQHASSRAAVERLLEESKYFIEWTARDTSINIAAELVKLQVQLAVWQLNLPRIWSAPEKRAELAAAVGGWSQRVLEFSGLLDDG